MSPGSKFNRRLISGTQKIYSIEVAEAANCYPAVTSIRNIPVWVGLQVMQQNHAKEEDLTAGPFSCRADDNDQSSPC